METRVALIGIIVGNRQESAKLNEILHEYGQYVVGRMGVPYKDKDINVISLIVDAPQDVISALSPRRQHQVYLSAHAAVGGTYAENCNLW